MMRLFQIAIATYVATLIVPYVVTFVQTMHVVANALN